MELTLLRHDEPLAVVRLGPGSEIPAWATGGTLFSVTATATETSLVCGRADVPKRATQQGPFTAFSVAGTLDFSLTGVLSGLLTPIAEAEVPVFTVSPYDTDWILVPTRSAEAAADVWRGAGCAVLPAHEAVEQPGSAGRQEREGSS
jgi:uncharacterized protein